MKNRSHTQDANGRVIAGIIIVVAGLLFMFNNLNMLSPELKYYIFSWKTLLIAIGTLNLLFSHNRTGGFIMLTVGLVFWIPDIFDVPMQMSRFIWPLAIIAVGLFLLFNSGDRKFNGRFWQNKINEHQRNRNSSQTEAQGDFSQDDYVNDVAVFGGGSRVVTSKNFKGGKLTAIFGGSEIRMHRAKLAPGKHVLDIFFVFGGSEIIVPSDWIVKVETISIFGGFGDKRYVKKPEEVAEENQSILVVKGFVLFGGAELKSY